MPGHNGGYNPYRDANGRFTDPSGHGKKRAGGDGVISLSGPTSRMRAVLGEGKVPLGRASRTDAPGRAGGLRDKNGPVRGKSRAKPPKVPAKYESYTAMSNKVSELERQHQQAQHKVELSSFRSRFPSADAYYAAKAKAEADAHRIASELAEARRDRSTYLSEMAKYRSQFDYED